MNPIIKIYHNTIKDSTIYSILALLAMLFSGCEKSLEPDFPDFLLSDTAIFENEATVNAAILNIYAGLRDNSPVVGNTSGMSALLGLYTDELNYFRNNSQIDNAFYNHTVLPNNRIVTEFWNNSYKLIYSTNAIIEGLENSPLNDEQKNNFLGEAFFIRAYLHFYLTQLYGDIPYIKTTDYKSNSTVSRMPELEVYSAIEQDLLIAKEHLDNDNNSGENTRVSKGAASALLARLYLYSSQWSNAFVESNSLISNGVYSWQPDLDQVFLKGSSATIWQLKPEFEGAATKEGETFVFDFGPPNLYALSIVFMRDFEEGDLRKEEWTREISDGTNSWVHPYKYKQNMFGGASAEYAILFRLAEQYLIRAEAAYHLGDFQAAIDDIDIIRIRAGLQPTNANTPEEIITEIIHQRRYELFTEQGHRWFDLKRTGLAAEILGPIKNAWKTTDILFPLPLKELLLNPKLNPQNPGY